MTIKTKQITVYLDDEGGEHATLEAAARKNAERKLYEILDDRAAYSEIGVDTAVEVIMKHWADLCEIMREAQEPVIEVLQDYKCPDCSAKAHDQHHDECPNYGEGPKS